MTYAWQGIVKKLRDNLKDCRRNHMGTRRHRKSFRILRRNREFFTTLNRFDFGRQVRWLKEKRLLKKFMP